MRTTSSFSDYQPIGHIGRVPIHLTTIFTALMGVGVIAYTMMASARVSPQVLLGFSTPTFLNGSVWQPLTYPFVEGPSFFTLLGIFCFYSWGIEVEKYLGRPRFAKFIGMLVLLLPLVCGAWHVMGMPAGATGNYILTASMLIAFATLYPNIEYFGWIPLKWFAFACFCIGSLMYFPERNWIGLTLLWASCGASFGFIRYLQSGGSVEFGDFWERVNPFKRRPKLRVLPSPARNRSRDEEDAVDSIDPLLDKIAKAGIDSLTPKERARLEKARQALMKREGH
jgi:putative effector of murein hydrolase LrgA (UPF0299 family)